MGGGHVVMGAYTKKIFSPRILYFTYKHKINIIILTISTIDKIITPITKIAPIIGLIISHIIDRIACISSTTPFIIAHVMSIIMAITL